MKYKSCHLIEHGISIDVDSIKACCLSREFDKGQLMIIPKYENNKIFWLCHLKLSDIIILI